jgi:hypothetical protein
MHSNIARALRGPLALTLVILGACADAHPVAPTVSVPATPNAALGDVFTVTNTNDAGIGSLRWSINFTTGGEIIRFDPSIAGQTITLDSTLYLRHPVTIEGPSAGITIKLGGTGRLIMARFPGLVTLRNVALTGAKAGNGAGGAYYGEGSLTLENALVYANQAGSAIAIVSDTVFMTNSTVSGTTFESQPISPYPTVFGTLVVATNSTIAHNAWDGLGSLTSLGRVVIRNTILSNNGGKNCVTVPGATFTREGNNVSDDDTCGGPSEIVIADAKLGALASNGGPTMTHALLTGSPAINTGAGCTVSVDQRYAPRDSKCDIGAFEFMDFTTVTITIDPTAGINQNSGWATLTGTVKCSRAESFKLALELHQDQRVGKTTTDVHAASTEPVLCGTTPRPWSASMVLTDGEFLAGSAKAMAVTFEAQPWVAFASTVGSVKLYKGHK